MTPLPLFGIVICRGRGQLKWNNSDPGGPPYHDFDAVWFLHLLGFPVVPLRVAHIYRLTDWYAADGYQCHPIRWSLSLVLAAWLRRVCWVLLVYVIPLLAMAILAIVGKDDPEGWLLLKLCIDAVVGCPLLLWLLHGLDRRNRDIRTVIGNWRLGSGDPVTFDPAWFAGSEFETSRPNWGTDTFAEGAVNCIKYHNWWGGMFAARMCLLLEDRRLGKELTDAILAEPEVRESIAQVRANPERWFALLGPGRYQTEA